VTASHTVAGHTAGIDWRAPIEAVHEDGRVESLIVDTVNEGAGEYYTEPDLPHLPQVWLNDGTPWISSLGGNGPLSRWRIRNTAIAKATAAHQSNDMEGQGRDHG